MKNLPEHKLNELAQRVSKQMLDSHFFDQGIIRGDKLKEFSEHKQINKFLIFQVYQVWEMQLNKLRHPYFNLDHPDINATLQTLKNQISQHIEVNKEDFRPMLERAVFNNLKLILNPRDSFANFFFAQKEKLPLAVYQRYAAFFSDLDFVTNSILRYYQKNEMGTVERDVFFLKMDKVVEVFNRKSNQDFDGHRAKIFQKLTGLDLATVISEVEAEEAEHLAKQQAEEAEKQAAAKREEEEAKQKAEAEAKRQAEAEAKRKAEEEAKRKAEEEARKQAEAEAKRKAEEEAKKQNFFDSLEEDGTDVFDLDDLDEEEEESTPEVAAIPEVEMTTEPDEVKPEETTPVEATTEPAPQAEEIVAEEIVEAPIQEEPVVEVAEKTEAPAEEPVKKASVLESLQSNLQEVSEEVIAPVEEVIEEAAETTEETVEEVVEVAEELPKPTEEVVEEVIETAEPVVSTPPPVVEEEKPKTIFEKMKGQNGNGQTHLDRFLSKQQPKETPQEAPVVEEPPVVEIPTPKAETPTPSTENLSKGTGTVLDQLGGSKRTVADQFSNNQSAPVHESLNGNRKIKLDEIPIHKQYQYVQKVFDGNNVRFRIIVDKINNAKNKDEVEDILGKFVLNNDRLDQSDKVVDEFIQLLRNRF